MLSPERALRKQQQLDNIISIVTKLAKPGDTIVDFCSGGVGNLKIFANFKLHWFVELCSMETSYSTHLVH